jgi:hypothetical protein
MGAGLISFLFSIGAATWIYTKFQRYSGNNTQQSVFAAGISGLVIFIIFFAILKLIL